MSVSVSLSGCLPSFTISSSCFFFASCNLVSGSTPDGYIEESIFSVHVFFCVFRSFCFCFGLVVLFVAANLIYRFRRMFVC